MNEVLDFGKVAPYFQDPLVLVGFFLFLFFGFARYVIKQRIIPQLSERSGYRVLRQILLYGFVLGLIILVLGFGLKYRELSAQEQGNAVSMLRNELQANMNAADQLGRNVATILGMMEKMARLLRDERIPVLNRLFPMENLELGESASPATEMARLGIQRLVADGLHKNALELQRAEAAGAAIRSTILRTQTTVASLADPKRARYSIRSESWQANLPILRKVTIVPISDLQNSYAELETIRNGYDVVIPRVEEYLAAVAVLFEPNVEVNATNLASALAAEHLAFEIATVYGKSLVDAMENLAAMQRRLSPV